MKSKLKSEGSFLDFLYGAGSAPKVIAILAVGILLLFFGNISFDARDAPSEEEKIAELCAMTEGVGECRVTVTYSSDGDTVFAVAVLCDGAESSDTREKITEMLTSLYGIGAHRISIMKLAR